MTADRKRLRELAERAVQALDEPGEGRGGMAVSDDELTPGALRVTLSRILLDAANQDLIRLTYPDGTQIDVLGRSKWFSSDEWRSSGRKPDEWKRHLRARVDRACREKAPRLP